MENTIIYTDIPSVMYEFESKQLNKLEINIKIIVTSIYFGEKGAGK